MPKAAHISTPWPTSEEVAKTFRIPRKRQRELRAMAEEYVKQLRADENAKPRTTDEEVNRKNASAAD